MRNALNHFMRIAISFYQGRVAPVFDVSSRMVLIDLEGHKAVRRRQLRLPLGGSACRISRLRQLGVELVICGAISHSLEKSLNQSGVRVAGFTCGDIDTVIGAAENGCLTDPRLRMPGSMARAAAIGHDESRRLSTGSGCRGSRAARSKGRPNCNSQVLRNVIIPSVGPTRPEQEKNP